MYQCCTPAKKERLQISAEPLTLVAIPLGLPSNLVAGKLLVQKEEKEAKAKEKEDDQPKKPTLFIRFPEKQHRSNSALSSK